jgi:tape measure domain-containing protein
VAAEMKSEPINAVKGGISKASEALQAFNTKLKEGDFIGGALFKKMDGIASKFLSVQGVGQLLNLSDTNAQTDTKLNYIVDDGGSLDEFKGKIAQTASNSRVGYQATADAVASLGQQAGDAFSGNDQMLAFIDQMNKGFAISGTSVEDQKAAMDQITQSMASGKFTGDELSNAPVLASAVKSYMSSAGVEGTMQEWADKGMLTADVIKNALFSVTDETNAKFQDVPQTFAGAVERIKSDALVAFQPALEKLSEFASSPAFQTIVANVSMMISAVAGNIVGIFDMIAGVAGFIADNWSWIEPILWGVIGAFAAWKIAIVILTVAQTILNLVLNANPLGLIISIIFIIIGAITAWAASVGGFRALWLIVVDALLCAWDWVKIAFFTGVYFVLDLFDKMKLGMLTAGTAIANFMGDMRANVLMILQNMVNGAIDIINGFINTLNLIPGVNISTINHVSFGTEAQLQNEADKQARNEALQRSRDEIDANIAERAGKIDSMKAEADANHQKRLDEIHAIQAEAEKKKEENNNAALDQNSYNSTPYDPNNTPAAEIDCTANLTSNIGGNSYGGNASNSDTIQNASEEDMEYMRDAAEREAINKFTTAEVKLNVGGIHNSVNSKMDLDGIADYIIGNVQEALYVTAEGVHA